MADLRKLDEDGSAEGFCFRLHIPQARLQAVEQQISHEWDGNFFGSKTKETSHFKQGSEICESERREAERMEMQDRDSDRKRRES